jgi:ubiquinone/menaquinone biosynthesis C-methylase UbiE
LGGEDMKAQVDLFNEVANEWNKNIPEKNYKIAINMIEKFEIKEKSSVLDVACGTGILFSILKEKNLHKYVGIDISENMVKEFLKEHSKADVRVDDFQRKLLLEHSFDYIIIFNSIPHFDDLDLVFENAYNNLNDNGTFIIAHCKTREELKTHHRNIGYISNKKEPIPIDSSLLFFSKKYEFTEINIEDEDYFCFSCKKK